MVERSDALKTFEGLSAIWKAPDSVGKGKGNKENQQEDVYRGADESLALWSVLAQSGTSMVTKGSYWVRVDLQEILSLKVCLDESRPKDGYQVQRGQKAKMENPTEANKTGSGGGRSRRGRTTNQAATGTRATSKRLSSGRAGGVGAMKVNVCKRPRPRDNFFTLLALTTA